MPGSSASSGLSRGRDHKRGREPSSKSDLKAETGDLCCPSAQYSLFPRRETCLGLLQAMCFFENKIRDILQGIVLTTLNASLSVKPSADFYWLRLDRRVNCDVEVYVAGSIQRRLLDP